MTPGCPLSGQSFSNLVQSTRRPLPLLNLCSPFVNHTIQYPFHLPPFLNLLFTPYTIDSDFFFLCVFFFRYLGPSSNFGFRASLKTCRLVPVPLHHQRHFRLETSYNSGNRSSVIGWDSSVTYHAKNYKFQQKKYREAVFETIQLRPISNRSIYPAEVQGRSGSVVME